MEKYPMRKPCVLQMLEDVSVVVRVPQKKSRRFRVQRHMDILQFAGGPLSLNVDSMECYHTAKQKKQVSPQLVFTFVLRIHTK